MTVKKSKTQSLCRHNDFTLIEMLVVIAIIAILASLLAPSLQSALKTAKGVVCTNNLKQSGILIHLYMSDYNGFTPEARPSQFTYPNNYWTKTIVSLGYAETPQKGDSSIFVCPGILPVVWSNHIRTYSFRGALKGPAAYSTFFKGGSRIQDTGNSSASLSPKTYSLSPASFPLVFDSFQMTGTNYYSAYAFINPDALGINHTYGAGMLFFDGHSGIELERYNYFTYGTIDADRNSHIPVP